MHEICHNATFKSLNFGKGFVSYTDSDVWINQGPEPTKNTFQLDCRILDWPAEPQITLGDAHLFFLSPSLSKFEFAFFLQFKCFEWPTYLCYPFALTASYFDCYSLSKVTATLSFYAAAEVPFMLDLVWSGSDHSVVLVHIPFYFVSFLSCQD